MISNNNKDIKQNKSGNITTTPAQTGISYNNMQQKYLDFAEFVKSSRFNEKSRTRHFVSYSKICDSWSAKVGFITHGGTFCN